MAPYNQLNSILKIFKYQHLGGSFLLEIEVLHFWTLKVFFWFFNVKIRLPSHQTHFIEILVEKWKYYALKCQKSFQAKYFG